MIGLPDEKKLDIMETVKLISRIKPGRFSLVIYFSLYRHQGLYYRERVGAIDFEKWRALTTSLMRHVCILDLMKTFLSTN
jgi:hypothetical protein